MDTTPGHLVLRLRGLRDLLEHLRLQGRFLLRSLPRQEGPALAGRPEVQLRHPPRFLRSLPLPRGD